jgi:hypothetical protein
MYQVLCVNSILKAHVSKIVADILSFSECDITSLHQFSSIWTCSWLTLVGVA